MARDTAARLHLWPSVVRHVNRRSVGASIGQDPHVATGPRIGLFCFMAKRNDIEHYAICFSAGRETNSIRPLGAISKPIQPSWRSRPRAFLTSRRPRILPGPVHLSVCRTQARSGGSHAYHAVTPWQETSYFAFHGSEMRGAGTDDCA